jgi:rare lipoprotein A
MKFSTIVLLAAFTPAYTAGGSTPLKSKWHGPTRVVVQYGIASWYAAPQGPGLTASGEMFNERDLTAAHRNLPFGTRVRVTNLQNGRSIVVRINDRGPFVPSRLIDLSKAAARRLAFSRRGLAHVKVAVVSQPKSITAAEASRDAAVGK